MVWERERAREAEKTNRMKCRKKSKMKTGQSRGGEMERSKGRCRNGRDRTEERKRTRMRERMWGGKKSRRSKRKRRAERETKEKRREGKGRERVTRSRMKTEGRRKGRTGRKRKRREKEDKEEESQEGLTKLRELGNWMWKNDDGQNQFLFVVHSGLVDPSPEGQMKEKKCTPVWNRSRKQVPHTKHILSKLRERLSVKAQRHQRKWESIQRW